MKRAENKNDFNKLNIAAGIIFIIAAIILFIKFGNKGADTKFVSLTSEAWDNVSVTPEVTDNKIVVATTTLSKEVTFFNYNSNGIDMQFMLLKTDDGRIRGAFNTCQVCNGSPYAYFEQIDDAVMCQNCGNQFALTQIGDEHGGCNPVPLEFSEENDNVVIDTAVLDDYADAFKNWKKEI